MEDGPRLHRQRAVFVSQSVFFILPVFDGIRNIRSQDYSFPGTFVPMMELSFSGPFVPWNICSRERMVHGTFLPWTIRSLEHSFPRPNLTWNIPSMDYDRSNTKLIVYVK